MFYTFGVNKQTIMKNIEEVRVVREYYVKKHWLTGKDKKVFTGNNYIQVKINGLWEDLNVVDVKIN